MKTNKETSFAEIGKELPFSVPENYFEQFAQQIEKQIGYTHKSVHKFIRPWMYAAAMFIGVLVLSPVFYTVYQNKNIVSSDSYESYVLSQVDETVLMDCYVDQPSNQ
jgi:hypothetical protein